MKEACHGAQSVRSLAVVVRGAHQMARRRDDNARRSIRHRRQRAAAESRPRSDSRTASPGMTTDRGTHEQRIKTVIEPADLRPVPVKSHSADRPDITLPATAPYPV